VSGATTAGGATSVAAGETALLLAILDQAYDHVSWHGTNLRGSIRRVTAKQAAWRPARGRHNIWELTVHAAYWKYAAWRRLTGQTRGSFPIKGSNWFPRPVGKQITEAAWRSDRLLLDQMHGRLRQAVTALSPAELRHTPRGTKFSNFSLLSGIAAHDLYHAGQIQVLKRLSPGR
jgi:hypothetical protein